MKDERYQFHSFIPYKGIVHGLSTKAFGSMKNSETKEVDRDALTKFARTIDITDPIVCMRQIHSGTVAVVENADDLRIAATDALVTDKKHLPLAVLTADCLPILFCDPEREVISVAHAGYRGLLNNVIEHTVKRLVTDFKSDPKDIIVGIGPGIERDCYEVGVELIEEFQEKFPSFENIFRESFDKLRTERFFLDLPGIAKQSLLKEGILDDHIEIMDICTKHDEHFYSYRGGDDDKRFVSVISLI